MKAITAIRTATMAAALLAAGLAAAAQPGPADGPGFGEHRPPMERMLGPRGAHGRWWNDPQVIDSLKLTEDQRKSMDDILQQHRETLIDMRGNVEKAEVALEPLMGADQPNESAILSQIDRVAQARAELEKANARFLLAIRARLTPDQWKQLQTMRSERHEGMRHQWRHGGPATPPAGPQGAPGATPPPGEPGPQSLLHDTPASGQPA
jgi:periplasmic protein CpxP/Spy